MRVTGPADASTEGRASPDCRVPGQAEPPGEGRLGDTHVGIWAQGLLWGMPRSLDWDGIDLCEKGEPHIGTKSGLRLWLGQG